MCKSAVGKAPRRGWACRNSQRCVTPCIPEKGRRGRAGVIEGQDPQRKIKRIMAAREGTGQEGVEIMGS